MAKGEKAQRYRVTKLKRGTGGPFGQDLDLLFDYIERQVTLSENLIELQSPVNFAKVKKSCERWQLGRWIPTMHEEYFKKL